MPSLLTFRYLVFSASLLLLHSTLTEATSGTTTTYENDSSSSSSCTIYMAPSSVKHVNGFGLYTVKAMPENTNLLHAPDGPSIPVVDFHMTADEHQYGHDWIELFNSYWWGRGVWDQVLWEASSVVDYQIMFGALPNHHCILQSIDYRNPQHKPHDDHAGRRRDDPTHFHPGAGAFSYYKGKDFFVHRDLEAGEELFLNYGKCEETAATKDSGSGDDWRDSVLKPKHIQMARDIVANTWHQLQVYDETSENNNTLFTTENNNLDEIVAHVKKAAIEANDLVASILPSSFRDLKAIAELTPSFDADEMAIHLAREYGTTKRTVEWIKENGYCMDHIVPGPSTIPHAGQGAMAQRAIPKGDMVVPVPTLHMLNKDVLHLYLTNGDTTAQLLLNYCIGHNESSLLMCPLTNAILINHCSERTALRDGCSPNAQYQWSSGWDPNSDQWRNMTLEQVASQPTRGLALEVVATRDIQPGEEIFVDYGVAWEEAWNTHVAKWNPPEPTSVLSAATLNEEDGPILEDFISGDLRKHVDHPSGIFTGCRYWPSHYDDQERMPDQTWQSRHDEDILNRYATNSGDTYRVNDGAPELDGAYWPCSVISSDSPDNNSPQEESTYTVWMHQSPMEPVTEWEALDLPRYVAKYPRSSIRYFNEMYTSNLHLEGVFRHPIHLRDEIFPEQWKNRKVG